MAEFHAPVSIRLAQWAMVVLAASIPLSTALDNILLALVLVLGILSGRRAILATARHNPVARAALLLFGMLALWTAYGKAPFGEALGFLGKYLDLAFVPLFMAVMREELVSGNVMKTFLVVMVVTVFLSWLVGLGILPVSEDWIAKGLVWKGCSQDNPAVFRSSITQNVLMAYAAYLLILLVQRTTTVRVKWLYIVLAILTGGSVLFLVKGKTGYLVLFGLLIYLALSSMRRHSRARGRTVHWKEVAGLGLLAMVLVFAVYQISPVMHERVDLAISEFKAWRPAVRDDTSTGERLEFYYHSLRLIKEYPLLGVGTGGFADAYAQEVPGSNVPNPHNEYLLITAQIGVFGLALLLYLFYIQWRCATMLPSTFEQDAARGLVLAIAITALFNSPLHDHTEGLFFAFASAILFSGLGTGRNRQYA